MCVQVSAALVAKEEELIHLHEDREEYHATLVKVSAWLQQADEQLHERIISIPEARTAHQVSESVVLFGCVHAGEQGGWI